MKVTNKNARRLFELNLITNLRTNVENGAEAHDHNIAAIAALQTLASTPESGFEEALITIAVVSEGLQKVYAKKAEASVDRVEATKASVLATSYEIVAQEARLTQSWIK